MKLVPVESVMDGLLAAPKRTNRENESFTESSEEEEPSYAENGAKPDRKDVAADQSDPKSLRRLLAVAKDALDRDGVFLRTRRDLSDEIEGMTAALANGRLSSEALFRVYEQMDDALDAFIDVSEAHLAVLGFNAVQLARTVPLEPLDLEPDVPVEEQENEELVLENTPALPVRKVKRKANDNDLVKAPKAKKRDEPVPTSVSTRLTAQKDADPTPAADEKPKRNGVHRADKSEQLQRKSSSQELARPTKRGAKDRSPEATAATGRRGGGAAAGDSDLEARPSAAAAAAADDSEEDRASDSTKSEPKRVTRRGALEKNGNGNAEKPTKKTGSAARRKRSDTPESEKPRRRAAALAAAASVAESAGRAGATGAGTVRRSALRALDAAANPDEQTYCLCDQISYGQMIGCDNDNCTIEWFHFGCVDIKAKPAKGVKWFCPLCRGDKSTLLKPGLKR